MDDLDRKLLADLAEDSRITYAELGRKYNLSRVCIRERINNLLETGIIKKFTIVVDPQKVGKNLCVCLDIEVKPDKLYETAQKLSAEEEIKKISLMTGSPTLFINALLEDHEELEKFLKEKIYPHEAVVSVKTNIVLKKFKTSTPIFCS